MAHGPSCMVAKKGHSGRPVSEERDEARTVCGYGGLAHGKGGEAAACRCGRRAVQGGVVVPADLATR